MPVSRGQGGRRDGGEFALLARIRAAVEAQGLGPGVIVGIGDDAAVLEAPRAGAKLVLTTDTMVEGVHFRRGWLTPRELGVRAFRAAVSDIAAMGARPRHVLVSLEIAALDRGLAGRDALALVKAVAAEARAVGASLVGGNISSAAQTGITVTVVGETAAAPLLRRGAKPGDLVFVTGSLGGAAAGWRALEQGADPATAAGRLASRAYRRPPLRLDFATAVAKNGLAHAMIDVSDGLLQDLGHVAQESRVAIRLEMDSVPVHRAAERWSTAASRSGKGSDGGLGLALSGGEDYELVFFAPPSRRRRLEALARRLRTPLGVIGVVEKGSPRVTDKDGLAPPASEKGFDHLKRRTAARARAR